MLLRSNFSCFKLLCIEVFSQVLDATACFIFVNFGCLRGSVVDFSGVHPVVH